MAVDETVKTEILKKLCEWAKTVQGFKDIMVFGSLFDETFGAEQSDLDIVLIFDETSDRSPKNRLETLEKFKQSKFKIEELMKPYFTDHGKPHVSPLFATGFELDYDIVKKVPNAFFRMSDKTFYSVKQNKKVKGPYSRSDKVITPRSLDRIIFHILQTVQEKRDEFLKYRNAEEYRGSFRTLKNMGTDFPKELARFARIVATPHESPDTNLDHGMQDLIFFCKNEDISLYNKIVHFTGREIKNRTEADHLTATDQMWLWEVLAKQAVLNAVNFAAGQFMESRTHTLALLESSDHGSNPEERAKRIDQLINQFMRGEDEVFKAIEIEQIESFVHRGQFPDAVKLMRKICDSLPDRSFAHQKMLVLNVILGDIHRLEQKKTIREGTQEYRDSEERKLAEQLHRMIHELKNH